MFLNPKTKTKTKNQTKKPKYLVIIHSKIKRLNGSFQFKHGESEDRSPVSQGPILKALETQKTLRRTKYLISSYNLNAHPGVIWGEIVTLD